MEDVIWTISEKPNRPRISATIFSTDGAWNLTTETGSNANLAVLENTVLLLICMAGYPVVWKKDKTDELNQTLSYDQFSDKLILPCQHKNGPIESQRLTPTVSQYNSTMLFNNVQNFIAGNYICIEKNTHEKSLSTELALNVHGLKGSIETTPQILQTGFDQIQVPADIAMPFRARDLSMTVIYSAPTNVSLTEILDLPGIAEPYFNIQDIFTNTSFHFTKRFLTENLKEARLQWFPTIQGAYEGVYKLNFEYQFQNGMKILERTSFFITPATSIPDRADKVSSLTEWMTLDQTMLRQGTIYQIRMYTNNQDVVIFPNSCLTIETKTVDDPSHRTDLECPGKHLSANQMYDECGILGLSLFDDVLIEHIVKGIQITMKATKPCDINFFASLSFTDMTRPMKSISLNVMVLDPSIFGPNWGSNFPGPVLLPSDPTVTSGSRLVARDSLTIQCLVPACSLTVANPLWCRRQKDTIEYCFTLQASPNISSASSIQDFQDFQDLLKPFPTDSRTVYTFHKAPTNFANSYTFVFKELQVNDSGRYECSVVATNWLHSKKLSDHRSIFELVVAEPQIPFFNDGRSNMVEKKTLTHGGTLILSCETEGNPWPTLSWSREGSYIPGDSTRISIMVNETGNYYCNASNRFGYEGRRFLVAYSDPVSLVPFAVAVPVLVMVIVVGLLLFWWLRRHALTRALKKLAASLNNPLEGSPRINPAIPLNEQAENLQYGIESYEVPRDSFKITEEIGKGEYGKVWRGILSLPNGHQSDVAVKVPADSQTASHYSSLITELKLMAHLQPHVNVLCLKGACTALLEKRQLYVMSEFCEYGSLRNYLLDHLDKFEQPDLNTPQQFSRDILLSYAYQAANGMEHLAGQNIVHRDIALRNLLLTANHVIKVSDFGLSRMIAPSMYYKKKIMDCDKVPLHWMALESIANGEYTKKSDVWSFGVLLWELFSCGRPPTPDYDVGHKDEITEFYQWLERGQRLYSPRLARNDVFTIIRQCWDQNPNARPTFPECKQALRDCMNYSTLSDLHVRLAQGWSDQCTNWVQRSKQSQDGSNADTQPSAQLTFQGPLQNQQENTEIKMHVLPSAAPETIDKILENTESCRETEGPMERPYTIPLGASASSVLNPYMVP